VCSEPVCPPGQLTEQGLASITRLGLSVSAFAVLRLFFVFTVTIVYATVSLLIFRAKRHDNVAIYVALVMLTFGAFLSDYTDVLRDVQPQFADLVDILPGLALIAFTILCYVFPDGHFFPRWTILAAWGWILAPVILIIFTVYDAFDAAAGPVGIALLFLLATCIIAPIQRYRKLSSRTQRQQLKWVLFGLTQLLITLLVVVELLPMIFPALDVTGTLPNILSNIFQMISVILFPITVGIALLRYRLWNVNMVINRTLVYVPLTSILTVIYTTSLAVSQRLFVTATGEMPQAVAIFTTIVLTTTFSPIKSALQGYVDRNFKEAPEKLKELDALGEHVAQVVQALDHPSLAQRVVETIVRAHHAGGAALYLATTGQVSAHSTPSRTTPSRITGGRQMQLVYATPNWNGPNLNGEEGEVSILLARHGEVYGRLLLGQPCDREDYTLDEIEEIRTATLPIVANMVKLQLIQDALAASDMLQLQREPENSETGDGDVREPDPSEIDPCELEASEIKHLEAEDHSAAQDHSAVQSGVE
jgi:hypothetical protein